METDSSRFDVLKAQEMTIEYEDADGVIERRRVKPKEIKVKGSRAYLEAYCYERSAPRTFRLDRIQNFITSDGEIIDAEELLGPYLESIRPKVGKAKTSKFRGKTNAADGPLGKAIDTSAGAIILFFLVWGLFKTETWLAYFVVCGLILFVVIYLSEWLKSKLPE